MYGAQTATGLGNALTGNYPTDTPMAPKAVPQISQRMGELNDATEQLAQAISELENRLSLALRPTPPSAETANQKDPQADAPLAVGIREMVARVRYSTKRLVEITQRVEL